MAELLLELLSEEIPARMQARAADDLKRLAGDGLKAAGLAFDRIETYVTPRRLALVVVGLPTKQADVEEEKRGPRIDAPDQAVQGFLRANGVTLDQCEKRKTERILVHGRASERPRNGDGVGGKGAGLDSRHRLAEIHAVEHERIYICPAAAFHFVRVRRQADRRPA